MLVKFQKLSVGSKSHCKIKNRKTLFGKNIVLRFLADLLYFKYQLHQFRELTS